VSLLLGSFVEKLGGELCGNPEMEIHELAPLDGAGPSALSFLSHPKYIDQLRVSKAGCVIVDPMMKAQALERGCCIIVKDPYLYFAKVTQLWKASLPNQLRAGIHPTAVVDSNAYVDSSASIGPFCVIESGARVGAGSVLKSRVTLGENCCVGKHCIIHSGVVIGADGFGFAKNAEHWEKIEQLGSVQIGDDVEIGANTCIDRGTLTDTVIENGVKLDNLIQIGHNVRVGHGTAMAGCVGIAGSATIGSACTIGGGAIVLGHLSLVDGVHISAATVVTRSIHKPGHYTGIFPLDENARWEKNAATVKQLSRMRERVRKLEESPDKEK
jgi:UDP-3-O-[3-hydroxymyristoyl] glucosamine N-acyltransferase